MKSAHLLAILSVIIIVAVIIAVFLSTREIPPQSPQVVETSSNNTPPVPAGGQTSTEPDLSVSHPLSLEEVAPLYNALHKKITGYKTAHVRTRLQFPLAAKHQTVETEIWFDAIRPHRFIHKAIKSLPKNKKSLSSEFVALPYLTEIYDGTQLLAISYQKRGVHIVDLTATDAASRGMVGSFRVQCATKMANPLQDLLLGVSFEDRLKEMAEAKRERTSDGEQIHVLCRITGAMSQMILKTKLLPLLPVNHQGLQSICLRKDIFDSRTGNLLQSIYLNSEWHPYLIQSYQEVEWDGEIPEDRFVSDAPPGSTVYNMNEDARRTRRLGITQKDLEEYRRAGNPMSASSLLDFKHMREREQGLEPSN